MKPPLIPTLSPRRGEGVFYLYRRSLRQPRLKYCATILRFQSATSLAKSLPDTIGGAGLRVRLLVGGAATFRPSGGEFYLPAAGVDSTEAAKVFPRITCAAASSCWRMINEIDEMVQLRARSEIWARSRASTKVWAMP